MNLKVIGISVLILAGVSLGAYYSMNPEPPSSEEFFRRNPHLTPYKVPTFEAEVKRTNDDFREGDFRLLAQKSYPVTFGHDLKLTTAEKNLFEMSFEGDLKLHSFGIKDRRLLVIVEYKLKKISNQIKLSSEGKSQLGMGLQGKSIYRYDNQIMARLDPEGKVVEMWASRKDYNKEAMELKVVALSMLFRKLPPLTAGSFTQLEADDRGVTFPVSYNIINESDDLRKIVARVELNHKAGANPQKAAAAGAPALSLISLKSEREQGFSWLWDRKHGIPVKQEMGSIIELKFDDNLVSASGSRAWAVWNKSIESGRDISEVSNFTVPVDFKGLLGRFGNKLKDNGSGGQLSFNRTNDEMIEDLRHVDEGLMSDTDKEKFFVELAHAVKENPSLISTLRSEALDASPGSRKVSMILGALGYSGTPTAQTAIIDIYKRDGASSEEKQKGLTEFALAPIPLTPPTKTFLKDVYKSDDPLKSDLSGTAGLALGSSISKDGDPTTVKFIMDEWRKAEGFFVKADQKDLRQEYLLTVMGNSKSDAFISQVQSAVVNDNPEVRAAAVNAVRFAQDERSREILFNSLENDTSIDVRVTAAQSLLYQPFDERTFSALQTCSGASQSSLKMQCYRVLSDRIEHPEVKTFLSSQVTAETDAQVSSMIQAALTMADKD